MRLFKTALTVFALFLYYSGLLGSTMLENLHADISDGQLDDFSRMEAAFIISGAQNKIELKDANNWYKSIINDIHEKNIIQFDPIPSAERLFMYLHTTWLNEYKERATTLFDIKNRREFNCVSSTVLYNLLCDDLNLTTEAFETPTHVYTIFTNFAERVMVENTTSMGFNIIKNLNNYSRYLAQYYPENQTLKIGLHRLYAYENSKGRQINNTELLGLICYNLAFFKAEEKLFNEAYDYVVLAQLFNQDSRSNQRFEISLYYRWGNKLYTEKKYDQAFEVLADAFYRYPDNDDFKNNCQAVYINALRQFWEERNWGGTYEIILEMEALNAISKRELEIQKKVLNDWITFLRFENRLEDLKNAGNLLQK